MRNIGIYSRLNPGFWLGGAVAALVMVVPGQVTSAQAATLDSWQFDPATHQLMMTLPKQVKPQYSIAAEPARIIVDLPNVDVGAVLTQQTYSGAVRQVRVAQFQPGLTRIVLELSPEAVLAPQQVELQQHDANANTQRWTLRPVLVSDAGSPTVAQSSPAQPSSAQSSSPSTIPQPIAPAITSSNTPAATVRSASSTLPESAHPGSSTQTASANPTASSSKLPPLEPGAVEIPVELSPSASRAANSQAAVERASSSQVFPPASSSPSAASPSAIATASAPVTTVQPAASSSASSSISAPISAPTAVASAPLPVDFAKPLSDRGSGTAVSLSLSAEQNSANHPSVATAQPTAQAATPASGSLSFPTPTSEAVSVPGINTVTPAENPQPTNPRDSNSRDSRGQRSRRTASADRPAKSEAKPPASSPAPTAATPAPTATRQPAQRQIFPVPQAVPASVADNAVQFGQPIPTPASNQVNSQTSGSHSPKNSPNIGVIQFGQPLPDQPST